MTTLNFRVTGTAAACERAVNQLSEHEMINEVDEVEALMPHMDDEDSSSAGLAENSSASSSILDITVHADNKISTEDLRQLVEFAVRSAGAVLEETERF